MSASILLEPDEAMKAPERQTPIRVLLVDDSPLVRQGLKAFLRHARTVSVVGEAGTKDDALVAVRRCHPDVVVLETRLKDGSGIELCRAIRHTFKNVSVLFLTAYEERDLLRSALRAGAHGFLKKGAPGPTIVESIETVANGGAILDSAVISEVMNWLRQYELGASSSTQGDLSQDDLQMLSLIASGKTNKEIGHLLKLEPSTVRSRLKQLYRRLRISQRSEAASHFVKIKGG